MRVLGRVRVGNVVLAAGLVACGGHPTSSHDASTETPSDATRTTPADPQTGTATDATAEPAILSDVTLTVDFDDATVDTTDDVVLRVSLRKDYADLVLTGATATCDVIGASAAIPCTFAATLASTSITIKKADLATAKLHATLTDTATKKAVEPTFELKPLSGTAKASLTDVRLWGFGANPANKTLTSASYCGADGTFLAGVMAMVNDKNTTVATWSGTRTAALPAAGCFLPLTEYASAHGATIFAPADVVGGRYAAGPAGAPNGGCSFAVLTKDPTKTTGDTLVAQRIVAEQDALDFRATTFKFRCK
jgi:hypothetical protein